MTLEDPTKHDPRPFYVPKKSKHYYGSHRPVSDYSTIIWVCVAVVGACIYYLI